MPLNDGAVSQIYPFASEVASPNVMDLEEYRELDARRGGFASGLARSDELNRAWRQPSHIAAGVAQFIANRYAPGVLDDGDLDKVEDGMLQAVIAVVKANQTKKYELCEFYYFRHPTVKPGFQAAYGGLLAGAADKYPEAWAYLQTAEGAKLCKTEAQWQAMTTATWATLANGTKVGWGGIGGAPFYAPNTATGALRLPDLRGMYAEAAGYDALGVGGVHGDAIRNITGTVKHGRYSINPSVGGFYASGGSGTSGPNAGVNSSAMHFDVTLNSSRVVPTGNANKPRAWGALPCVYLGPPVS